MLTIVCFLWNDPKYRFANRYTVDHVNRLASMVNRNLSQPHEFVCVTDIPEGINPDVRIVPLWDDFRKLGGTWTRVKMFDPAMKELLGDRLVLMDLDCVVTGKLDPLFDTDIDFITTLSSHRRTLYNTGFFILTAGSRASVWSKILDCDNPQKAIDRVGAIGWEQAWVSLVLGEGEKSWGRQDGVLNYQFDVVRRNYNPEEGMVVFFPGDHDPSLIKSPWIERYWR